MKADLPLVSTGAPDETRLWLDCEHVNVYPEVAPDARSNVIMRNAAGLIQVLTLGGNGAFIRGMRVMGDLLYAVSSETLWQCDYDPLTETWSKLNLGTILGGARCGMADAFVPATSRQLIIGTGERGYVYDTITGLAEIVDANFATASSKKTPVVAGGYVVWDTPDGMLWSDLQDPMVYPALNFRTAEAVTDGVVGNALVYNDVWMMGSRSTEAVRLTGLANEDAFELVQVIDYGIASAHAVVNADNKFFFLESRGRVFVAQGFNCQRVSSHQIEQWLSTVSLDDAFCLSFVDRGHEFVLLTVPESKTECFDIVTQAWSRRKSYGMERWRPNANALFKGFNVFGDQPSGHLRRLDPELLMEGNGLPIAAGDAELVRELKTPFVHQDTEPFFIYSLDLVIEVGTAYLSGDSVQTDPVVEMRYSDDGGFTWSEWTQRSLGRVGKHGTRVQWFRLGRTRQRVFHFRVSDPVRCDFISARISGVAGVQA